MRHLVLLGLVLVLVSPGASAGKQEPPTVVVRGPTIVAFFVPVSEAELEKDPDTNEALADFQVYAERTRKMLDKSGITFEVLSASSFKVRTRSRTVHFRPRIGVGYYFFMPGKRPRIEYGVQTDDGIREIAEEYFGMALPHASGPV